MKVGDRVTAEGHIVCGRCHLCRTGNGHVCPNTKIIGVDRDGCFAEFIAMPATNVWHLDDDVSFEVGGIHDPMGNAFHTALHGTELPGATVLVTGCGPIGIFAVGICRAAGASRIIASDVNPKRLELARAMGAHDAVQPNDAAAAVKAATDGLGVDVVLEMSGVPAAIHQAFALVRVGGRVQILGIPAKPMELDLAKELIFKGVTVYGVVGRRMYETWIQMTQFLRSGQFDPRPVITHRFPLEEHAEAIRVIKSGRGGEGDFRGFKFATTWLDRAFAGHSHLRTSEQFSVGRLTKVLCPDHDPFLRDSTCEQRTTVDRPTENRSLVFHFPQRRCP